MLLDNRAIKTKKLTHADLGQMQLYVNYFDEEVISQNDNPTIGLILCTNRELAGILTKIAKSALMR